jgi:hypothetical protein
VEALRDLNAEYQKHLQHGVGDADKTEAMCFKGFESAKRGIEAFNRLGADLRTENLASVVLSIYLKGIVDWAGRIADCLGSESSVQGVSPARLTNRLSQIDDCSAFLMSLRNAPLQHGMHLLNPAVKEALGRDLWMSQQQLYNANTWIFGAQLVRLLKSASQDRVGLLSPMHEQAIESRVAYERTIDAINEANQGNASTSRAVDEFERAWDELVKLGVEFDRFSEVYADGRNEVDDRESSADPVMEYVNVLRDYASNGRDRLDLLSEKVSALEKSNTDEQWTNNVRIGGGDAQSQASSKAAQRRKNKEKSIVPGAARPSVATAPVAEGPQRSDQDAFLRKELLIRADQALRPAILTASLAMTITDPLQLARSLGRYTGYLAEMENKNDGPLLLVQKLRMKSERWFGTIDAAKRAIRSLDSFSRAKGGDEEINTTIDALRDRIQALEIINRQLDAREADALKTCRFPKGQDLKRLMDLDNLSVSGARKLPSHDDESPEKGKLFEIEIMPSGVRPDGRRYDPLYLHMHSKRQVTAEECLDLQFNDFAAVHVKNLEQRGKGANWERLQQRFGNEHVSVHRGPVDGELLQTLLGGARAFSGAASTSRP